METHPHLIITAAARSVLAIAIGRPLLGGAFYRVQFPPQVAGYLREQQMPGETVSETILRLNTVGYDS